MSRPPFSTIIRDTPAALAGHLGDWARDAASTARGSILGLAVGTSTLPLYGSLPVGSERMRIVPIDELRPPPADPGMTFVARLRAALPPRLAQRVEALPHDPAALDAMAAQELDAVVLGLGTDGHIAFNQPGSEAGARSAVVRLTPENLTRLGAVAPATGAITMGVATILSARRIALVAAGAGKEQALQRVLDGPEGSDVPATWLRRHPAVTILMDGSL